MVRHQCPSRASLQVDMPWNDTCLGSAQGCARTVGPAPTHLPVSTQPQHLLQVFSSTWAVVQLHRLVAQLNSAAPPSKPPTPVL